MTGNNKPESIRLTDLEGEVGKAKELPPADKARLSLAQSILGALLLLLVLSGFLLIYGPTDRLTEAQSFFEFAKTFVPPIITLVIGFYFRNE